MSAGSMVEIERKFLVHRLPGDLAAYPWRDYEQGYLEGTDERLHVRVRLTDAGAFLTIKQGEGLARTEVELPLAPDQAAALWPLTEGRRLTKRRYRVPLNGLELEVDVYSGALAGLVVCEVEFASVAQALRFSSPVWFGPEVTEDARYSNFALAAAQRIPEPQAF